MRERFIEATATGVQLAAQLDAMARRLRGGEIPRLAGLEIRQGIDKAESIARRKQAFLAVIDDVDPHGTLSRWATAQAIEDRLKKFKSAALRRIKAGGRVASDDVESALVALCDQCGPDSARRIWDALNQLGLTIPRQK